MPTEYTFLGYWGAMAMKVPVLLFYSWRAVVTIPLCILFFIALYNRQIAEHLSEKWKGISPWWSVAVIGILLIWGVMWAIYERDREVFVAYKAAEDKAVKADQQIAIAASEYYLIDKDGSRIGNSGIDKYGLFVKRDDKEEIIVDQRYMTYKYILRFKKSPSRIEVTTQEGAIPTVKRIDADVFEVIFHSSEKGFMGTPIVKCSFKVQVY